MSQTFVVHLCGLVSKLKSYDDDKDDYGGGDEHPTSIGPPGPATIPGILHAVFHLILR